uniref:Interferon gamma-related protein n=1 Tax=Channa argus TaxID=215402 RepID=A0A8G0RDC0_CHAAH|nr:interferon gamma-related protein [Channa argus]
MSSSCSVVFLLVSLGVALVFGACVPENLVQTHDSIADVLELKEPEIGKRPLFGSLIKSIDTSCQKKEQVQLMNLTLDIYAHIFSSILQHNHQQPNDNNGSPALLEQLSEHSRPQVELDLTKLQQKMENLRKRLNQLHHQQPNHEDVLSQLQKIKVDDPLDQKKALAEFNEVYQAACVITSHRCGSSH